MIIGLVCTLLSTTILFVIYTVIVYDGFSKQLFKNELLYAHLIATLLLTICWYVVSEDVLYKYEFMLFLLIVFLQVRGVGWCLSMAYCLNNLPLICMIATHSLIIYLITMYFQISFRYLVSCLVLEIVISIMWEFHIYFWWNKNCFNKKPGRERVWEKDTIRERINYIPYFPFIKVFKED